MRTKRLFSQIAVASAVALILAGCSSNNENASDSALPKVDMMKTGSVQMADSTPQQQQKPQESQSTLKIEDLIPEWRGPATPRKKQG